MTDKATGVARDTVLLVTGGVCALVGFQALVAAAIIGLATVLPAWAAALIVGVVLALVGGTLAVVGLKAFKQADLAPGQTVATMKENVRWARQQVH